ncbi:MAG: type II secretion system GspH family protein [Planctomycetes bacterium]|nr:type II secretion system GspH family protein [Planctomycetota bacterium]
MRRARGFTLLEMLIAMGILTTGLASVLALFSFGAAMGRTARERERGALAVEAVRADLAANLWTLREDGTIEDPAPVQDRPVPNHPGLKYSATLRENPELPGEYGVDIEIVFREKGRARREVYRTILVREVPFERRMARR